MKKLQSGTAVTLYEQLCNAIKEKIQTGEYKPGDRIPSEEQLAKMYGISRITVRSGIEHLVKENLLVKKHGKGTFVSLPVHVESTSAGGSFTKSCILTGKVPSTEILERGYVKAGKEVAKGLNVEEGSEVIRIIRLRLMNDVPSILEIDYFREEHQFMLNEDLEKKSLLEVIREETGVSALQFEDIFDVTHAQTFQAKYLKIPLTTALLLVRQSVIAQANQIIYYNEQYIYPERYKYAVRTQR